MHCPAGSSSQEPAKVTQRCAYEGPAGLEFSGAKGVALVRDFTPTALTYKEVGARFYINVDSYHGQTDGPLARVTLRNTVGDQADVPLVVEFDIVDGKAQTRLVRNDSVGQSLPQRLDGARKQDGISSG